MVVDKSNSPGQNKMSAKGQLRIRFFINAILILMLAIGYVLSKNDILDGGAWIPVNNVTCVAVIYLLVIYYQYSGFPERQRKLKSIIDSFANFLALIAVLITFISVVIYGEASSLYVELSEHAGASIIVGVIIGVLSSRVLFPFWDIYSKYRKV